MNSCPIAITVYDTTLTIYEPIYYLPTLVTDPDGDPLTVLSITAFHGEAVFNGEQIAYTEDAGFKGTDTVAFTVSDGICTVYDTIFITILNSCPNEFEPHAITTDGPFNYNLNLQSTDWDDDALVSTITQQPAHGTAEMIDAAHLYYNPDSGFVGTDILLYSVTDGTCDVPRTMIIEVVGDCAAASNWELDQMVTYSAIDLIVDGDWVPAVSFSSLEVGGVNTLTFIAGSAMMNFLLSEVQAGTVGVLSESLVNPVGSPAGTFAAQVLAASMNVDFYFYNQTGSLQSLFPDLFICSTPMTALNGLTVRQFVDTANHILGGGYSSQFTPGEADSILESINKAFPFPEGVPSQFALDHLSFCPCAIPEPVNHCPVFATAHDTVPYGGTLGTDLELLSSDPDNDSLSFTATAQSGPITITNGVLFYESNVGFTGTDVILITVSDGTCEIVDTIFATVEPAPNNCPVAGDVTATTNANTPVTVQPNVSDADNDVLTVSITQSPLHGAAAVSPNGGIVYTPSAAYSGPDQFAYSVTDGVCSDNALVTITITAPPVCPNSHVYWKDHQNAWAAGWTPMTLGTVSYTKQKLVQVLSKPVGSGNKADASLILAKQLIAAKLNILNGVVAPQPVLNCIAAANALLTGQIPKNVKPNTMLGQQMMNLAACLEEFNSGELTNGCPIAMRVDETETDIDASFHLTNVPNPFAKATAIRYHLPYETTVTIDVYNYLGQQVVTLVNETQTEGAHTVNFDATLLPGGVYNCRLQAGDHASTIKLVLMK